MTKVVVDAKYMADFNSLNKAEEEEGRRHLLNANAARAATGAVVQKKEERAMAAIELDEESKRKRQRRQDQEEQEEAPERSEETLRAIAVDDPRARLFEPGFDDCLGDETLNEPHEMKRRLGSSQRFAQHAMLLAEAKKSAGLSRREALAYLAGLYLALDDREYANKALREFGPATGIVDLYPLELVDHLLDHHPGALLHVERGLLITRAREPVFTAEAGQWINLQYDERFKLRGFAIVGGERVGYWLEPGDAPGRHQLRFGTPGIHAVLLSGSIRKRATIVDRLLFDIRGVSTAIV